MERSIAVLCMYTPYTWRASRVHDATREFATVARMRPSLVLLALAVLPLQTQMPVIESIEVRVVNVDVVVTDRDGKPVTGLTKEDFEILEDKRPQKITNFYEVRGGESVQAIEQT